MSVSRRAWSRQPCWRALSVIMVCGRSDGTGMNDRWNRKMTDHGLDDARRRECSGRVDGVVDRMKNIDDSHGRFKEAGNSDGTSKVIQTQPRTSLISFARLEVHSQFVCSKTSFDGGGGFVWPPVSGFQQVLACTKRYSRSLAYWRSKFQPRHDASLETKCQKRRFHCRCNHFNF